MITLHILPWALCLVFAAIGGYLLVERRLSRRKSAVSPKSAELEKIERRVSRIQTADLGQYLEVATTSNFEAVHAWTRATLPLDRSKRHHEALAAARLQAALLEEQAKRGLV